jgi:hypothetical protein
MSTDLDALAGKLRSQLLDLGVEASATSSGGSGGIELQLSSSAGQALSDALGALPKGQAAADSPADQEWEARSERVSEMEGFTGGDASD